MSDTVEIIEDTEEALSDSAELNSSKSKMSYGRMIMFAMIGIGIIGAGGVGAYYYLANQLDFGKKKDEAKIARTYANAPEDLGRFIPVEPKPEAKIELPPEPVEEQQPMTSVIIQNQPQPITSTKTDEKTPEELLLEQRYKSKVNKESNTGGGNQNYASEHADDDNVEGMIGAHNPRQVKLMRNIDYALIKGTIIPCTLETNIISEKKGFVSCVISQDVYSSNARILLVEKGSKVSGEYRQLLKNGERRLEVIWDRIVTPYDVVIKLMSPSVGRLGASGITGKVDNRWGTRIGSALLVSLISDALEIAGEKDKKADVVVESETADTGKGLAEKILEKNIDLPPILYIQEGKMINIYVADDIDMSSIYSVKSTY